MNQQKFANKNEFPQLISRSKKSLSPTLVFNSSFLQNQNIIGNHGFLQHNGCSSIHPKLKIIQPNDIYEETADWTDSIDLKLQASILQKNGKLKHHLSSSAIHNVPPLVNEILQSPSQPLDNTSRKFMEQWFDNDFSNVRVHTDSIARESAELLKASAFTIGKDIVFKRPLSNPLTLSESGLLTHELTHVLQNKMHKEDSQNSISNYSDKSELEADRNTLLVFKGEKAAISNIVSQHSIIQRAPETWFRGEVAGVKPATPGSVLHDFGDGLYLTNREDVARMYISVRSGEASTEGTVLKAIFDRRMLGNVLDLTHDDRWQRFMQTKMPNGVTYENLIKMANENYGRFFKAFLDQHKINIKNYDAIIGPEYVRGGTQICIKTEALKVKIKKLATVKETVTLNPSLSSTKGKALTQTGGKTKLEETRITQGKVTPKELPRVKTHGLKFGPRIRYGARVAGGVGVGLLIGLLSSWIQSKSEEKRINSDIEKLGPKINKEIDKLRWSINAYLNEAPNAKLYANITVELIYCSTPDPDLDSVTVYQGVELKSVSYSQNNILDQRFDRFKMYLIDRWEYIHLTFSSPITIEK